MTETQVLQSICNDLNEAAKDSVVEFRLSEFDPLLIWQTIKIWVKDPMLGEEQLGSLTDPLRALIKETFKAHGWTIEGNNTKTVLWLGEKLYETKSGTITEVVPTGHWLHPYIGYLVKFNEREISLDGEIYPNNSYHLKGYIKQETK